MIARSLAVLVLVIGLPEGAGCSSSGGSKGGEGGVAGIGGGSAETSGGGIGGAGAAGGSAATTPDILIVLDRSGSMNDGIDGTSCTGGCGANSKWALLTAELGRVLSADDTEVRWGLKLFASNNSCAVADGVDVAPQLSNAAGIAAQLGLVSPNSSTPTTAAVSVAAAYLSTLADGARKYILLVTDGAPNCGSAPCDPGSGDMTGRCDDANAIGAVKQAYDALGIPTFVLGVGLVSAPAEATLTELALKGGAPRATDPFYYPVESAADLSAAFSAIVALTAP